MVDLVGLMGGGVNAPTGGFKSPVLQRVPGPCTGRSGTFFGSVSLVSMICLAMGVVPRCVLKSDSCSFSTGPSVG